ncbi:phosphoribosylformylglycinamidine cyclo-ligase [Candidatus Peregrinibacteria bacterium]|jgi:phosphoribosylformylglycinamidine cyclo-ligase|nr:phosphoribosylformylglycinamidine cyclo-ligase [Candidatus Peregrinibacteria bacterium]MBT4632341.1 phosphoribosylformylglycinamidine cyclo-ligase [Candidatus Peregrinibacteria bacterium]MBT5517125.1 phosphoribosylformylglycinamidine cyclo-ligase [Candidatus Peregrinibacteria bacterium]MBT5824035.1 phosphoribosylformylglycinamidine cyclo-ligase [Candidatus Peregrinibacteria bacterium]
MTTYEDSGVNVEKGDACSRLAYEAAKATFAGREGMIGAPAILEGGFSGAIDMGDFFLVQNDDGVGSKMMVAEALGIFDTVGRDLVAMVADDAICVGAEVISLTNTVDIESVDEAVIGPMMEGLREACLEQKIVVPGGEIAELGGQVNGVIWNATAVGIVEKDKFIDGSKIAAGDVILGLRSAGFRSNGFSLIRKILTDKFGEDWASAEFADGQTWGEVVLEPSLIYHRGLLNLLGAYGEARPVDVHGLVHVTGGGLDANFARVLPEGLRAEWGDLWAPHEAMVKLMEIGSVPDDEARKTWNMGTGMIVVVAESDVDAAIAALDGFEVKAVGKVA